MDHFRKTSFWLWNSQYTKIKFSIKIFFSKCDQIRRKLRIWSQLLKKTSVENFFLCGGPGAFLKNSERHHKLLQMQKTALNLTLRMKYFKRRKDCGKKILRKSQFFLTFKEKVTGVNYCKNSWIKLSREFEFANWLKHFFFYVKH